MRGASRTAVADWAVIAAVAIAVYDIAARAANHAMEQPVMPPLSHVLLRIDPRQLAKLELPEWMLDFATPVVMHILEERSRAHASAMDSQRPPAQAA